MGQNSTIKTLGLGNIFAVSATDLKQIQTLVVLVQFREDWLSTVSSRSSLLSEFKAT